MGNIMNNNSYRLRIFLMGGTKDSINIIKFLRHEYSSKYSPYILTTTTTDYGAKLAKDAGSNQVIGKPLPKEEILNIITDLNSNNNKNTDININNNNFNNSNIINNKNNTNTININNNINNKYTDINNKNNTSSDINNSNINNNFNNTNNIYNNFDVFIDATHPFASNVTSTAIECSKIAKIPYIRFERPDVDYSEFKDSIIFVDSFEETGKLLSNDFKSKNILHLAGVNTIETVLKYGKLDLKNFFVRVLPVKSSIEKCNFLGINGENIIAMQGVFSKEFNKSLMKELDVDVIITKESGEIGGAPSKIEAAHELGIDVILVNRPKINNLDSKNIVNNLSELKIFLDSL